MLGSAFLPILAFLAVAFFIFGVYSIFSDLFLRDRTRLQERITEEFRAKQREQVKRSPLFKDLRKLAAEAADELAVPKLGFRDRLEVLIDQSGTDLTVSKLLGMIGGFGFALSALALVLFSNPWFTVIAGSVGAAMPFLYVRVKRNARLDKLRSQLPDAFDLMARCIRAGQSMNQAMAAVAEEFPQPIAGEFSFCSEQQNLGLAPEAALRDLAHRTGLIEIKIFVVAIVVQRQSGGNLAEILEKLASMVRERFRIRGTIKTLTAEGRLQAVVLMGLPPLMFFIMLVINRTYAKVLLEHSNLIVGMLVAEGLGALWIRKIINFDF